jgi:hypothetical protein
MTGCVAFNPAIPSGIEDWNDRPSVAVLRIGFDVEITKLSSLQSVEEPLPPDEEATLVARAIRDIQEEARWQFLSRLSTGHGFRFASFAATDAVAEEVQLQPGEIPNAEQLAEFRRRLGVDLVVVSSLLDYGKVRWQWLLAGMLTDMTAENIALGIATAWNPIALGANLGFELLTSTPAWFGGGYLFGVAFRPVRIEARAFETVQGYPIWQDMEESAYAWGALQQLPEPIRGKTESQLMLNLAETIESLGDSLTRAHITVSRIRGSQEVAQQ